MQTYYLKLQMNTLLKPEQINSKFLKGELMHHLFWRLNYPIVVDEYSFMDVFGVRRNGYGVEFEVKVSKADLCRELKMMTCDQPMKYSKDWSKWSKHAHYLKKTVDQNKFTEYQLFMNKTLGEPDYFIPNEFYFYVPDFLADFAVQATIHCPYGVIKCGKVTTGHIGFDGKEHCYYWRYTVVKKAVKLHSNKVSDLEYRKLAHALTIRNRIFHEK